MRTRERYFNKEMSWLSFNYRVLMEARDDRNPLFERVKFLSIYASNLDEFFRMKLGTLKKLAQLGKKNAREYFKVNPKKTLSAIYETVGQHYTEFQAVWSEELLPQLSENGIDLLKNGFSVAETEHANAFFKNRILSFLRPVFLSSRNIGKVETENVPYFLVKLITPKEYSFAIVNIPADKLPRFFRVAGSNVFKYTFIDDIIRKNLDFVFSGYKVEGAWSFRIYRDESINIQDEYAGNLIDKIRDQLDSGIDGLPTNLTYDKNMPDDVLRFLLKHFKVKSSEVLANGPYQNLFDLSQLPNPLRPRLERVSDEPICYSAIEKSHCIFDAIERTDHLLYFPFHSYDPVLRFINEAAIDPKVKQLKITLYRIASDSIIANALITAARNGKKVIVFVEVKARTDEAHNLYWAKEMEKAGITIIYSLPALKVHSKIALIYREVGDQIKGYAYLSTGNFNEKTARLYCDFGYFTSKSKIVGDLNKVFDFLYRKVPVTKLNQLLVTQYNLKGRFIKLIDKEIKHAGEGKRAKIIIKVNNLEDHDMIDKLYEAALAGVNVIILVRGICCLKPLENIQIIRIIDKYLEHARAFYFHNSGKPKVYLSSADWMKRNLYHRVEIAFPVNQKNLREEVCQILQLQTRDNVKAVCLDENLNNVRRPVNGMEVRSQEDIYEFLRKQELAEA